jgi:hypothetical protein
MALETRTCRNCQSQFAIEPDDFSFYEKIGVPTPTLCPQCRLQRRLSFRNERNFYRRTCDLCKRSIIAVYPADAPFPVYCQKCWWGDGWDPKSYGRDFDFSKTFTEQFAELSHTVPALSIMNDDGIGSTNCEWCYDWAFSKNVYLSACGWYVENGYYLYWVDYAKDVIDCWGTNNAQLAYELANCDRCYNCRYCTLAFDCNDCTLGFDLRGCSKCIMCVGLRNKQYHILNQPYSKEDYAKKVEELRLDSRASLEKLKVEFQKFALAYPRKFAYMLKSVNSTGDSLWECKLLKNCFYAMGAENCRNLVVIDRAKDTYDCNNTGNPELCYESVTPDNSRGNKTTIFCWKCTEAEYSNNCHSCMNVFGSTGLKHTSYAVLNKQYSKEEFIALRERIIGHMRETGEWGEFFPYSLSPFAYNETAAAEWFPMAREEALERGFHWKEGEQRNYTVTKRPNELPDTIQDVADAITSEVIACAHDGKCNERCTEAFKVVSEELQLYRRMGVPLPILCPNCRHYARLQKRNPPMLWHRRCTCGGEASSNGAYRNTVSHDHGTIPCPNEFETSYAPEREEIVYCESCYNSEIA